MPDTFICNGVKQTLAPRRVKMVQRYDRHQQRQQQEHQRHQKHQQRTIVSPFNKSSCGANSVGPNQHKHRAFESPRPPAIAIATGNEENYPIRSAASSATAPSRQRSLSGIPPIRKFTTIRASSTTMGGNTSRPSATPRASEGIAKKKSVGGTGGGRDGCGGGGGSSPYVTTMNHEGGGSGHTGAYSRSLPNSNSNCNSNPKRSTSDALLPRFRGTNDASSSALAALVGNKDSERTPPARRGAQPPDPESDSDSEVDHNRIRLPSRHRPRASSEVSKAEESEYDSELCDTDGEDEDASTHTSDGEEDLVGDFDPPFKQVSPRAPHATMIPSSPSARLNAQYSDTSESSDDEVRVQRDDARHSKDERGIVEARINGVAEPEDPDKDEPSSEGHEEEPASIRKKSVELDDWFHSKKADSTPVTDKKSNNVPPSITQSAVALTGNKKPNNTLASNKTLNNAPADNEKLNKSPASNKKPGNPATEQPKQLDEDIVDTLLVNSIIGHRTCANDKDLFEMRIQHQPSHPSSPRNESWESELDLMRDAPKQLFAYWHSVGGREKHMRDPDLWHFYSVNGHEVISSGRHKNKVNLRVTWIGWEEEQLQPEDAVKEAAPKLVEDYWAELGGRDTVLATVGKKKRNREQKIRPGRAKRVRY